MDIIKELRIGNYITNNVEIKKIDNESFIFLLTNDNSHYANPVLLTEDWLLEFGFEKCEGQYGVYFKSPHDKQVRVYFYDEKWCIGYKSDHPRGFSTIGSFIHVHKLQNFHFEFVGVDLI